MRHKYENSAPEMECMSAFGDQIYPRLVYFAGHEMDIRDLKFDSDSFDVAIDKGKRNISSCPLLLTK